MYKQHYQHFLEKHRGELHCAPHSHHYWPDVTRQAHLAYWDDSAIGADEKWDQIFSQRVPAVQQLLADLMNHPQPQQWVFASNTHELLYRIISCFDATKPLHILTTDAEFHSFSRQARRLQERPQVTITQIPTEPFDTFATRWQQALTEHSYDMVFCSQVFFNSGVVAPWVGDWLHLVPASTTVVIDGYHGCGAIPTDLSDVCDRIFYLAGSYKYLQAGEGCCFMSVPEGTQLRPEYTGWFADFANLAKPQQGRVEYADDGFRFAGATMDFTALYRLQAVLEWWRNDGLTVTTIHAYVRDLQQAFLQEIDKLNHPLLNRQHLLMPNDNEHGHFLTFAFERAEQVAEIAQQLNAVGIKTDYRNTRLRFGFALYHEKTDFKQLQQTTV